MYDTSSAFRLFAGHELCSHRKPRDQRAGCRRHSCQAICQQLSRFAARRARAPRLSDPTSAEEDAAQRQCANEAWFHCHADAGLEGPMRRKYSWLMLLQLGGTAGARPSGPTTFSKCLGNGREMRRPTIAELRAFPHVGTERITPCSIPRATRRTRQHMTFGYRSCARAHR